MTLEFDIKSIGNNFAAYVKGVDLTRELPKNLCEKIEQGLDQYAVLIFPNQNINDKQQRNFSRRFGVLERPGDNSSLKKEKDNRLGHPEMADVGNLASEKKPYHKDDKNRLFNLGNRLWHSDSSFKKIPAKYSILSARSQWKVGGETEFADMRAAYDELDEKIKVKIENMVCEHSLFFSRQMLGFDMAGSLSDTEKANFKPVPQPLVRSHPVTGRKSLFLAAHIGTIKGWLRPDAMCFIRDLTEHATSARFVYRHHWKQYDLVMWDNRQTMHRGRAFDDTEEIRDIRRTTVEGHYLFEAESYPQK